MISPRGVGDIESMYQVPQDFLFDNVRKLTRVWSRRGGGVYNRRNVSGTTRFSLWPCEEAHEGMISPRGVGDIYNVPNATRFSLWRCEESHEGMISPRGVGDNESMLQVPRDFLFDDMRKLTRVWYRQLHWINPTFVFWLSYAWEILCEMTRNIGPRGRCENYLFYWNFYIFKQLMLTLF